MKRTPPTFNSINSRKITPGWIGKPEIPMIVSGGSVESHTFLTKIAPYDIVRLSEPPICPAIYAHEPLIDSILVR